MKTLLLAAAALVVGLLVLQWRDWPPGVPEAPDTPTRDAALESIPEAADAGALAPMPRSPEEYASIVERPLFLSERRPPPEQPEEGGMEEDLDDEEVGDLSKVDLHATLILSPERASVWFRDPSEPELVRLRLGEDYLGWTLAEIEDDRVRFERQGTTETVDLYEFNQPGGDGARARRTPQRQPRRPPRREAPR